MSNDTTSWQGDTIADGRHNPRRGMVLSCLVFLVVAAALAVVSSVSSEESHAPLRDETDVPQTPTAPKNTLIMTEEEFARFLQERTRFDDIPGFIDPKMITDESQEQLRARQDEAQGAKRYSIIFIELPDRLVAFSGNPLIVDFDTMDSGTLSRLPDAFAAHPVIHSLFIRNFRDLPALTRILQATHALPFLQTVQFRSGEVSQDMLRVLAENSSTKGLWLVARRLSPDSFAELAGMTSLESLGLSDGSTVTPDYFITLAKLPRFRGIYIGVTDGLNVPIDDEVRRAIESLDGRLEEFVANEMPTTVHGSVVSALLRVKSLKRLELDLIGPGLTLADFEQLEDMDNLTYLNMYVPRPNPAMSEEELAQADAILRNVTIRLAKRHNEQFQHTSEQGSGSGF